MIKSQYSEEEDVYDNTGFDSTTLQTITGKTVAQLTNMINGFIAASDRSIKRALKIPITIHSEKHLGDGQTLQFQLGPWDEDFGIFAYDPTDSVEMIYAIYDSSGRVRVPYPSNCELGTEKDSANWGSSNATLSDEQTIVKCGSYSLKAIFSAAGNIYYPSAQNLEKNIKPWKYVGMWIYCSDATVTITFSIVDVNGKTKSMSLNNFSTYPQLKIANTWEFVRLNVDEFTGDYIDLSVTNIQYVKISVDKPCTLYVDNLCFNDGWFFTYPSGTINYCRITQGLAWFAVGERVRATYSYDPYKTNTSEEIKELSAKKAALKLVEYLIGVRQQKMAFEFEAEQLGARPDYETLETTRTRLQAEIDKLLEEIGYGFQTGINAG